MKLTNRSAQFINNLGDVIREKPYSAEANDPAYYIEQNLRCRVSLKEVISACWQQKTISPVLRGDGWIEEGNHSENA
jgi:hypothetical protein